MIIAATAIVMLLQSAILIVDLPEGYPTFPERALKNYPKDIVELKSLSDQGDGYATLKMGASKRCDQGDEACDAEKHALLQKAYDQGETTALALIRHEQLDRNPSAAEEIQPAAKVCGRTVEDLASLSEWINAFEIPKYGDPPQPSEQWLMEDASGDQGSEAMIFTTSEVSVYLIFRGDDLNIVRTLSGFDVGTEQRLNIIREFNGRLAEKVCPNWRELGDAIKHYFMKVLNTWPPGGIHFEGDGGWLAASGVTPDIFWFDLYVNPLHNPYTSGFDEEFDTSLGVFLKATPSTPVE